jgi:dual-specificity kinase
MSTPSTAVATTIQPQYGLSHYQAQYQALKSNESSMTSGFGSSYSYANMPRATNSSRPAVSATENGSDTPSQSYSTITRSTQKRQPNWREFYKNGVPKEIILIEDTPPPSVGGSVPVSQNGEHASKKRRTDAGNARAQNTYSNNNTPQFVDSNSNTTISLDRTTSIQTTAPTSLGSHGSTNSSSYIDTQATGQKRKRITRQATASDRKKQATDAFNSYVPPRKPPIKANDVPVRVIREV